MKSNEICKAARKDKAEWLEDQCIDIERFQGECESRAMHKLIRSVHSR